MSKRKRIGAIVLTLAMLATTAACTNAPAASQAPASGDSSAPAVESTANTGETAPIKWLTVGDTAAKPMVEGDRIVAEINQQLGIQLTAQIVPEGNVEKINVAMASGDFPDIVTGSYGTAATQQWIDNGMVLDLSPYFDTHPNLKRVCEEEYAWTAIDGKYYGVPFITQFHKANALIGMRGDWLEKLNLSYPETLEDMKTVLTAFTQDDPDGNGQNDTVGLTAEKPNSGGSTSFDWVFYAYGREYADYALDADGTLIPWFEGESFIPGMTYIKDLWDSGVVDKELFLNDNPKKEEKFYQGKAGAMQAAMFRNYNRYVTSLTQVFPEGTVAIGLPPKGPDGDYGLAAQGKSGMFTAITAACKNPEKAADFIDLMLSEEGNNLLRLGIEGIHYTKDGDTITFNEEERAKDAFADNGWAHPLAWGSFYWPLESDYLSPNEPNREMALETTKLATQAQKPNLIKEKTPLEIKSSQALNDIMVQYFSDMLQDKLSIEEGAAKLKEAWRSQGGEELLAEVNQVYQDAK